MLYRTVGLACSLCAVQAAFAVPPASVPAQEVVSIYLRPGVVRCGAVVTLGDVAALEGGVTAYRQRLLALDLADLSPSAPELDITKEQVAFRLRLAGVSANQFRLLGATHTRAQLVQADAPEPSAVKPVAAIETKPPENPVIIKPRDQVHLQIRVGPMRLTTLCEAEQEGRAGQMIRVRNIDSRTERVGRVVDRTTVELEQEGTPP